jgi:DNA-binding NtrC family response regulator
MTDSVHPNVLLVGCNTPTTRLLLEVLAARGIRGTVARDVKAAGDRIPQDRWDLVFVELETAGGGGLAVVEEAKRREPELPVVMISGEAAVPTVVRALRAGCDDFLTHPLKRRTVEELLDALLPNRAVPLAAAAAPDGRDPCRIVGRSPALLQALTLARKAAQTSLPIVILGESGTGKELVANLIHQGSRRAGGPYVRVNCAALSDSLLESELFGHERGAFTGAVIERKGRFELADGGTLLLDEVTETGLRLQAELLRVLDQQDFERVGGSKSLRVNVRVISTTNRDLPGLVHQGRFRADLYYRLAGMLVAVPPLRQRPEDIPLLTWYFVNEYAREVRRSITALDPDMMDLFQRYDWPGNVRQLRSAVRTALVLGSGDVLSLAGAPWLRAELEACLPVTATGRAEVGAAGRSGGTDAGPSLRLRDVERHTILKALRVTGSHQALAAKLLGITDRTLREKLRRYRQEGDADATGDRLWLKEPA